MEKVKDDTTIEDKAKRAYAERVNILCAKNLIKNRAKILCGADFTSALKDAASRA
jgi:5-methylthioribose kinase